MTFPIGKFLALDQRSQYTLLKAWCLLCYYRAAVLCTPFKCLCAPLDHHRAEPPRYQVSEETIERAGKLAYLVDIAARYTPWNSTCLVRVLVLQRLMAGKGIGGRFYLGVCIDTENRDFKAHAWLRCGEKIINGGRGYEQYMVITTFSWLES